jgi:hypothetical protein
VIALVEYTTYITVKIFTTNLYYHSLVILQAVLTILKSRQEHLGIIWTALPLKSSPKDMFLIQKECLDKNKK